MVYGAVCKRLVGKATPTKQKPLPTKRVLLVDNNTADRQIVQAQLTALGMRSTSAASCDEALQFLCEAIATEDRYALAIIDMEMLGMNGTELAQAIKNDPITKDTRVVILYPDGHFSKRLTKLRTSTPFSSDR